MAEDWISALRPAWSRLLAVMQNYPEIRQELIALCRAFANELEAASAPREATSPPRMNSGMSGVRELPARLTSAELGTVPPSVSRAAEPPPVAITPPPGEHGRDFVPLPLATVAHRCRIKRGAARLMAHRAIGNSIPDTYAEETQLRKQAEAIPDCGLWMLEPGGSIRSKAVWDDLAGGYEVCASAAELLLSWVQSGSELSVGQEVLTLAAEAQSMLLYAVADVGWVSRDHEQVQMFVHIRELGKQHQIYVPRYLRREDPADPARWPDLAVRLKTMLARLGGASMMAVTPLPNDPTRLRLKTLNNLKFKLRKLAGDPSGQEDEWPRIVELLDQAMSAGMQPNSPELRELVLPVFDRIPADLPTTPSAERIFRALELTRECPPVGDDTPAPIEFLSPSVAPVADYLRGKELAIVGGTRKPHAISTLKRVFGLADLQWLSLTENFPISQFEAALTRPEVVGVVLTLRWFHHHYQGLKQQCDKYGKPLIWVKAELTPNQVAEQFLAQLGERTLVTSDSFSAGL